jgi:hypothetical protein
MSDRWILLDQETGLHVGWYFWLRVLDEVNRSARYGAPFGLLLLEAEADATAGRHAIEGALASVPAAIRSTDLGGLLGPARVGVMLTEQAAESAAQARIRLLERLAKSTPHGVRWTERLLTYPEDGGEISSLLTLGWAGEAPRPDARPA